MGSSHDIPFFTDEPTEEDLFGHKIFAENLARKILSIKPRQSVRIAVTAPWGNGKTTALGFLRAALEEQGIKPTAELIDTELEETNTKSTARNIGGEPGPPKTRPPVIITFNPVIYDDPEHIVHHYYLCVMKALQSGEFSKSAKIKALAAAFADLAEQTVPIAEQVTGSTVPLWIRKLAFWLKSRMRDMPPVTQSDRISAVQNALAETNMHIVVMIDEIDRLTGPEIETLFRLIRLTADFKNVTYVAAFDREMVVTAMATRLNGSEAAASRFLEKIFQAEIDLPGISEEKLKEELSKELLRICNSIDPEGTAATSSKEFERFDYALFRGLSKGFRNRRVIKRFLNQFSMSLEGLRGHIHIPDLIVLEAVKACEPATFLRLKENLSPYLSRPDNLLSHREKMDIASTDDASEEANRRYARIKQQIFQNSSIPNIDEIVHRVLSDGDSVTEQGLRIPAELEAKASSRQHTDLYFQHIVPDDVPDLKFVRTLRRSITDGKSVESLLSDAIHERSMDWQKNLLGILSSLSGMLDETQTRSLISDLRSQAFDPTRPFAGTSALHRSIRFVVQLMGIFERSEQYDEFANFFRSYSPHYALAVCGEIREIKRHSPGATMPREHLELFEKESLDDLLILAQQGALFEDVANPLYETTIRLIRFSDRLIDFHPHWRSAANKNPEVARFVFGMLAGENVSSSRGSYRGDFNKDCFTFLRDTVSVEAVNAIIRGDIRDLSFDRFPTDEDGGHRFCNRHTLSRADLTLQMAQFVWFVRQEEAEVDGAGETS